MKLFTKTVNENAEKFANSIFPKIYKKKEEEVLLNKRFDEYVSALIDSTLN